MLYVGNIDPRDGGECRITKEFRLIGSDGYVPDDGQNLLAAVRCILDIHFVHVHPHYTWYEALWVVVF